MKDIKIGRLLFTVKVNKCTSKHMVYGDDFYYRIGLNLWWRVQ